MKLTKEQIELMTKFAWAMIGTPYKLGGNVPQHGGMDCSAFCLELLRSQKLWGLDDATAKQIYTKFYPNRVTYSPSYPIHEGDFLFFGEGDNITHIAYAVGSAAMIEAGGNDQTGMIRLRPISWRRDLVAVARFA